MNAAAFLLQHEILYSTPNAAIVTISDVLPELTRGNGMPVGGIQPLTTSALTSVYNPYVSVIPQESRNEKKSQDCAAVLIPQ